MTLAAAHVLTLPACTPQDIDRVGGKAVGLGGLQRQALRVPAGFVVTTDAYREWLHAHRLDKTIAAMTDRSGDDVDALSTELRALFNDAPLSGALEDTVSGAYAGLGDHAPVAVRSSATAEDSAEASFAGQQESYLWVVGPDAVLRQVRECWSSLFTPQALSYRARLGIASSDVAMAVVVQEMVDAAAAGVMITLDPLTGDPSQVAIEAAFGLGLPVVGGEITPDSFRVDKVTRQIRNRTIAHKPFADRFDRSHGGVRRVKLTEPTLSEASLYDEEVLQIAELGMRAEEALGGAQDMEWAIGPGDEGPRTLHFVQARPETVWSNRRRNLTAGGEALGRIARMWAGAQNDRSDQPRMRAHP